LQPFWRITYHTKRYKDVKIYGEGGLKIELKRALQKKPEKGFNIEKEFLANKPGNKNFNLI
jgi:hypothetical protein